MMIDDKTFNELVSLRAEVRRLRKALLRQSPGIDVLLKRRGFKVYKKEPDDDLLIPAQKHRSSYYRMLHKYSFRLFLRDVLKRQEFFTVEDVTRYATQEVTMEYLDYLLSVRMIKKKAKGYALVMGPIMSFGATLEWFVAEIIKREFGAETVWGVKFRRPKVGGDYDVIARLDSSLIYLEVKSSPPKQIYDSEIASFFDRIEDLAPGVAVFLMDTELRMKDKLVPMFEKELQRRYKEPPDVLRMERELFQIQDRIFIINAKESLVQNIGKVVNWFFKINHGRQ